MKQVNTFAVIYKLTRYSDSSAIASAFSPEHGKIKLFMNKAYSKKGGVMRFIPGTLIYTAKESSDLYKFGSFAHNPEYYHYLQTPEIITRLHLLFDIFDNLFETGQSSKVFWKLLLKFDPDNYRKLTVYTIYRLLKDAGVMFELECSNCGNTEGQMHISNGKLVCINCSDKKLNVAADTVDILFKIADNDLFKDISISETDEKSLTELFINHLEDIYNSEGLIKSYKIFKNMLF